MSFRTSLNKPLEVSVLTTFFPFVNDRGGPAVR